MEGQAEVAVAAFSSGIAVSANMHMGGFDTHGNHDQNHARRLDQLLSGIDHLWNQIELNNMQDRVTVVVAFRFRPPHLFTTMVGARITGMSRP